MLTAPSVFSVSSPQLLPFTDAILPYSATGGDASLQPSSPGSGAYV